MPDMPVICSVTVRQTTTAILIKVNVQYSFLLERPLNTTYFFKASIYPLSMCFPFSIKFINSVLSLSAKVIALFYLKSFLFCPPNQPTSSNITANGKKVHAHCSTSNFIDEIYLLTNYRWYFAISSSGKLKQFHFSFVNNKISLIRNSKVDPGYFMGVLKLVLRHHYVTLCCYRTAHCIADKAGRLSSIGQRLLASK